MPGLRKKPKASNTMKKNIKRFDQMKILLRDLLNQFGRDKLNLVREIYKRKFLGRPEFIEDIERGEKAVPKPLINILDENLVSNRRKWGFMKVLEKELGKRKLYDMDKAIERANRE